MSGQPNDRRVTGSSAHALAAVNRRHKRHDRRQMRQRLASAARTINVRNVVIRAFLSPRG